MSDVAFDLLNEYDFMQKVNGSHVDVKELKIVDWVNTLYDAMGNMLDAFTLSNPNDITIYDKVDSENYKTYFIVGEESLELLDIINQFNTN